MMADGWPLVIAILPGRGTTECSSCILEATGVAQSFCRMPCVSPAVGLRHQKNWSVPPIWTSQAANAASQVASEPVLVPPHSPAADRPSTMQWMA